MTTRLLLEIPTEIEWSLKDKDVSSPVVQCVFILPLVERLTDLNGISFNPGDGKTYQIYEAEELKRLRDVNIGKVFGPNTHGQYRVKGVQVYP